MQFDAAMHRRQSTRSRGATRSGLESLVTELSRIRDALRMFPTSFEGAAAVHREAARTDALIERLQRASSLPRDVVHAATARFALLLETGATPEIAMQMALRDAIEAQFAVMSPDAASPDPADAAQGVAA